MCSRQPGPAKFPPPPPPAPPLLPADPAVCCLSLPPPAPAETPTGSVVLSWGRGEDGQLGHGDAEERQRPQAVFSLIGRGVSSVHCGAEYSLSVAAADKQIYSWGWGDFGRLGTGDCKDVFIPFPLPSLAGRPVASVACGDTHTLVATQAGELFAFGRNQNGQLGIGSIHDGLAPQQVSGLQVGAVHALCRQRAVAAGAGVANGGYPAARLWHACRHPLP